MDNMGDKTYVRQQDYYRCRLYNHIFKNDYTEDVAANLEMIRRVTSSARYDRAAGRVRPCTCNNDGGSGSRCKVETCLTNTGGFECADDCATLNPTRPCSNRQITTGTKKTLVRIRSHRNQQKGLGLFLTEDVSKGDFIGEVRGVLGMGENLPNSYCFEIGDFFKPPRGQSLYLDLSESGNEFRYLNTDCKTNAVLVCKAIGDELRLGVFADKKISKGTELTVNYTNKMLHHMPSHQCNVDNCIVKNYTQDRDRRGGIVPLPRTMSEGSDGHLAAHFRVDLIENGTDAPTFHSEGLGPILCLRKSQTTTRVIGPPPLPPETNPPPPPVEPPPRQPEAPPPPRQPRTPRRPGRRRDRGMVEHSTDAVAGPSREVMNRNNVYFDEYSIEQYPSDNDDDEDQDHQASGDATHIDMECDDDDEDDEALYNDENDQEHDNDQIMESVSDDEGNKEGDGQEEQGGSGE